MLLALAIIGLIAAVTCGLLTFTANAMSDSPGYQTSYWPTVGLAVLSGVLFAGWRFGA